MSMEQTRSFSGACLCGAVRYVVTGELRPIVYCHCEQCRRSSGHFVAATDCDSENLQIKRDDDLQWYRSSAKAQRGFCRCCGSSLFWLADGETRTSIMAGTLTRPTTLAAASHIYVHMASDYYSIDDGLPQYEEDFPISTTDVPK